MGRCDVTNSRDDVTDSACSLNVSTVTGSKSKTMDYRNMASMLLLDVLTLWCFNPNFTTIAALRDGFWPVFHVYKAYLIRKCTMRLRDRLMNQRR